MVSVIVGERVRDGVVVAGTLVNALSGKVSWPEGTHAERSRSDSGSKKNFIVFDMVRMIPLNFYLHFWSGILVFKLFMLKITFFTECFYTNFSCPAFTAMLNSMHDKY